MRLAAPIRPQPKRKVRFPTGPFTGMRDTLDPTSARKHLAKLLENCYPLDPQFGGAVVGRPGFYLTTGQGGGSGARTGQLVYQLTKLDGTEYTVRIIGGKIETYNWSTDTWTNVVTAANLTTAGITLSTTSRIRAITFADTMLITDGVNIPFTWTGASGAGGLTRLTNSPVIFGRPTVYYAKWFGIKNTERSTLVWSEEGEANTGFEAGGYNNAWTLGQTDQNPLYSIVGTNEALYALRARSITGIAGAVTPDFSTSGTREGVSETVGTTSPDGVFYHERKIFFPDRGGRPHVLVPGLGVMPIWDDYRETLAGVDKTQVTTAAGLYSAALELALFSSRSLTGTNKDLHLAYHMRGENPQAAGIFRGYSFDVSAEVKDGDGRPVIMHLDDNGYAYVHGRPDGAQWDDEHQTGTLPVRHVAEGPIVGAEDESEKLWDRLDFTFRTLSDMTGMSVRYRTPRGLSAPQSFSLTGAFSRFDISLFDEAQFGGDTVDQHKAIGTNGNGRWQSWRLEHEADGEQFGLSTAIATGRVAGAFPGTP